MALWKTCIIISVISITWILYSFWFNLLLILLLSPLTYFSCIYVKHLLTLRHFPPGPFPLPVIGNLHMLGPRPHKKFKELSEQYGPVFSVSLGMSRTVIVNTIEPAKEVLVNKGASFAGRPPTYTMWLLSRGGLSMGFADYGSYWIAMRKFGHSTFQGFAKNNKLEELTVIESEELHKRIKQNEGTPMDPKEDVGLFFINVICNICFGYRYKEDDNEYKEIVRFTGLLFAGLGQSDAVVVLPWLRVFPLEGLGKVKESIRIRDPIYRRILREHIETYNPDNIRDITDAMLQVRNDKSFLDQAELTELTDDHIEMFTNALFIGAIETSLSTIRWGIMYLIHWPQYQDIIYDEMIEACGSDRYPTLTDRPSLSHLQSFIQETLRYSSMAPLGIPHKAMKDCTISGLPVPKGAHLMINHWNCHFDERHWDEPNEFKPSRWLDENGNILSGRMRSFLPFGAGRRNCFGETVARQQLFTLFSRMVKDFHVLSIPDEPLPSLEGKHGITLSPVPFKVIFKSRKT